MPISNGRSLRVAGRRPIAGVTARAACMIPAITLFALVPGIRAQVTDGRDGSIDYLVANFDELVYV